VRFWKVEEPLASKLVNVPEVPVSVPKALVPVQVFESPRSVEEAVASVAHINTPPDQVSLLVPVHVERPKPFIAVPNRFVVEALVLKKFVVVALVPVALTKVRFWRVEEPVARILVDVMSENMFEPVQVLLSPRSVVEAVEPEQPTHEPTTSVPMVAVFARRSEVEAVPSIYRVEPVALVKAVFASVDDPVISTLPPSLANVVFGSK
jgi:hypothetical protein